MIALSSPARPLGLSAIALSGALAAALAAKTHLLCTLICVHGQDHDFSAMAQICDG
ncbi:hypothetical protein [Aurantimonas sp. VKM B-3413]|uniref:hypothetical protein n=1 Tax=Aurantimonas sp. VKM B-3413 TaxID=2779401 RepID=UPI001E3604BC|nr:hypothetical protein [Aurantimonas sp. VKM B-3413]MCB8836289.1 hypothetical protein [Aurantimonas sp. VKM B-3413]